MGGQKAARRKKTAGRKRSASKRKLASKKKLARKKKRAPRGKPDVTNLVATAGHRGLGSASGGQSGDLQGLPRYPGVDFESVEELLEEGQSFEAEAVSGVENAKDPDEGEVTTSELPEDDVPPEYTDRDKF